MATRKSTTKGAARAFAQRNPAPGETQRAPAAAAARHTRRTKHLVQAILAIPPSPTGEADLDPERPRDEPRAERFATLFDDPPEQRKPQPKARKSRKKRASRRTR